MYSFVVYHIKSYLSNYHNDIFKNEDMAWKLERQGYALLCGRTDKQGYVICVSLS